MSSSMYVYVGPVLFIKEDQPDVKLSTKGCVNKNCIKCHVPIGGKYCPECGHQLDIFGVSSGGLDLEKIVKLCPEFNDYRFRAPLYNNTIDGHLVLIPDIDEDGIHQVLKTKFTDFSTIDPANSVTLFYEKFKPEITGLSKAGIAFDIKFGAIRYWG